MWQEIRAQKAAENRKRTEMVRKQREDARLKKEAEQREREEKQQEEHRRRIAAEKKKVRTRRCKGDHTSACHHINNYSSLCGMGRGVVRCVMVLKAPASEDSLIWWFNFFSTPS